MDAKFLWKTPSKVIEYLELCPVLCDDFLLKFEENLRLGPDKATRRKKEIFRMNAGEEILLAVYTTFGLF